jgi:hypothetical protein
VYRVIEPAFTGIFNFITTSLPLRIAEINAEISDGITLPIPDVYEMINRPNNQANTAFSMNLSDIIYGPEEFGTQYIDLEFSIHIFMKGAEATIDTLLIRYMDAVNNVFMDDCSLGGTVDTSGVNKSGKAADVSIGAIECECKARITFA